MEPHRRTVGGKEGPTDLTQGESPHREGERFRLAISTVTHETTPEGGDQ